MMKSILKNLAFLIAAPGSVLVFLPYLLLSRERTWTVAQHPAAYIPAVLLMTAGIVLLAWCVWNFFHVGKGTPAPIDPPKNLVISGPYRYVRNPMYLAVAAVLLGQAIFFHSSALLVYMLIIYAAFHLFVIFYEEPTLRRKFGASYVEYCKTTSRWLPYPPRRFDGRGGASVV